ncbi:MAG: hypothetical protein OWU84_01400 [Firmicutes bacterium]|nr:hypothetical protein [Bacillota bacterium]
MADVTVVTSVLNVGRFAMLGGSGGGPYALASAAVASCLAPYRAGDLDYWAGMAPLQALGLQRALEGEAALLGEAWTALSELTIEDLGRAVAFTQPDRLPEEVRWSFSQVRSALSPGFAGWADDMLALVSPWDFALEDIVVPFTFFTGEHDDVAPPTHAQWLAQRIARPECAFFRRGPYRNGGRPSPRDGDHVGRSELLAGFPGCGGGRAR